MRTLLEDVRSDLAYSARQLWKTPAFSIVAVLTLAIGIGANTVIFSQVNAVLLRMLPVQHPEELQQLEWTAKRNGFASSIRGSNNRDHNGESISEWFSYPAYLAIRDHSASFSEVICMNAVGVNLGVNGRAERGSAAIVSGNYFRALGADAVFGRVIVPDDDRPDSLASVAVLGFGFWQRAFGGSASVLGQTIHINGSPSVIIGVMPRSFFGLDPGSMPDVIVPMSTYPAVSGRLQGLTDHRDWGTCRVIGRLRPDVAGEKGRLESEVLVRQEVAENPPGREYDPPTIWLYSLGQGIENLRSGSASTLYLLMAVVALILLISCANVAGLLLARATARTREIATRIAVGAPRKRLVRQLLTESLLLSLLGGAFGVVLAYSLSGVMPTPVTDRPAPLGVDIRPDLRVLVFTGAISMLTGLLFGIAPALRATRIDLVTMMKQSSSASAEQRFRFTGGKALVAIQVALSLLLLIGAGLFIRTLANLRSAPLGFDPQGSLVFKANPALNGYKDARLLDYYENAVKRLESLPGVISASMSRSGLLAGDRSGTNFSIRDSSGSHDVSVLIHMVAPRFFETWKIPLLLGHDVSWTDREGTPRVAIVNDAFVKKHFPNTDPVGQTLGNSTIIGIVADSRYGDMREALPPTVYVPYRQRPPNISTFVVRTNGNPAAITPDVRRVMSDLDPNVPIFDVLTQLEQMDRGIQQERLLTRLLVLFGGVALLLCCLGIYGMLAYAVGRQTPEIGLRMALGAPRGHVVRLILRHSLMPVAVGIVIGMGAALMLTRLVQSMLFGVPANDPLTIAGAALVFLVIAAVAATVPARRASRIDPLKALRYE